MTSLQRISTVVLAAGLSRRYGASDKLLADFRGKPLAAHVAKTIADLSFHQRIAVCPDENGRLATLFLEYGFKIAVNADPAKGQAASVAIGVEAAIKSKPEAIMICLGDMPRVTATIISKLVDAFGMAGGTGIVSAEGFRRKLPGPPALFAPAHFRSLMSLEGDVGARAMLRTGRRVLVPDDALLDLDSPDDFVARDLHDGA